mmetsp:Transcript_9624/g.35676  ORF Transcript_9624/g.35676 Transcript_9624/m.35676 type:complete len:905 (-) Transcript_9624:83-2797(-)|eukprot:CAMPEP_0117443454 /NCGR_PEP_ID=MMETSP0759-20121206/4702_1 /TAXON_ID=63605 /ORGANISM="Percolomonas cosmopolitus, Strain WS" /LENGTH=904 /DNA_ID=CAMNT_0005235427 /DNA_START=170 /DNA_END=2884 /DNA_ORIENTATION=-
MFSGRKKSSSTLTASSQSSTRSVEKKAKRMLGSSTQMSSSRDTRKRPPLTIPTSPLRRLTGDKSPPSANDNAPHPSLEDSSNGASEQAPLPVSQISAGDDASPLTPPTQQHAPLRQQNSWKVSPGGSPVLSKNRPPYSPSTSAMHLGSATTNGSSASTDDLHHMLREVEDEWNGMSKSMSSLPREASKQSSLAHLQTQSNPTTTTTSAVFSSTATPFSSTQPSSLRFQQDNIVVTFHAIDNSISFEVEYKYQTFERHLTNTEITDSVAFTSLAAQESINESTPQDGTKALPTIRDIFNSIQERKTEMIILNISCTPAGRSSPASPSRAAQILYHNSSSQPLPLSSQISSSSLLDQQAFKHLEKIVLKVFGEWYIECSQSLESDLEKRMRITETWILNTGSLFNKDSLRDMRSANEEVMKLKTEVNGNLCSQISSLQEEIQHSIQSWNLQHKIFNEEHDSKFSALETILQNSISEVKSTVDTDVDRKMNQMKEELDGNMSSLHTVIEAFTEKLKEVTRQSQLHCKKLSKKVDSSQSDVMGHCDMLAQKQDEFIRHVKEIVTTEREKQKDSLQKDLAANTKILKDEFYANQEWLQSTMNKQMEQLKGEKSHMAQQIDIITEDKESLRNEVNNMRERLQLLEKALEEVQNKQLVSSESLSQTQSQMVKQFKMIQGEGARYKNKLKKFARKLPYYPASFGFCETKKHSLLEITGCNKKVSYGLRTAPAQELFSHHKSSPRSPSSRRSSKVEATNMKWASCMGDAVWVCGKYRFVIRCEKGDSNWRVGLMHPDCATLDVPVGSAPRSIALQVSNQTVYVGGSDEKIDLEYPITHSKDEVSLVVDFEKKTLSYEVNGSMRHVVSTKLAGPLSPCISMMVPVGDASSSLLTKWKRSLAIVQSEKIPREENE